MNKPIALVVDWFGPYETIEEAREDARGYFDSGLYFIIGKTKHQKGQSRLQYVGIAKDLSSRVCNGHECICEITRDRKIWLGEVASPGIPGKKNKVTNQLIDLAEWAHIYFLQPELNTKKTSYPPDRPVTVFNRWWKTDIETPRLNRVHKDWPDIIDFRGIEYGANIVWMGGKRKRLYKSDFE